MNKLNRCVILPLMLLAGCCVSKPQDKEVSGLELKPAKEVTFFNHDTVAAAFAKGTVLIDGKTTNYQVHASRRVAPGQVEIHSHDTDIIYIMDGTATFVTGGTCPDSKETAPGEFRGSRIEGGTDRKMIKGDIIVIPAGIPHWFKEVPGEFHYYTIKVR